MASHDWNAIDPERLATAKSAVHAMLAHPRAALNLAAFYDPQGGYAAATFQTLAPNDPQDLTPSDLLAVTLMDVSVRPAALRRLLEPGTDRDAVLRALRAVPPDFDLAHADAPALDAAAAFYQSLKDVLRGNKWVTASKIAARKRPSLIPVRDSVVVAELGLRNRDFREDWTVIRHLLQDGDVVGPLRALARTASTDEIGLADVSDLRLLDTLVWMYRRTPPELDAADLADE